MFGTMVTSIANLLRVGLEKFVKTPAQKVENQLFKAREKARKYLKKRSQDRS